MTDDLLGLVPQLPLALSLLAMFMWFQDRLMKQFMEFLREERAARQAQTDSLKSELAMLRQELREASSDGHGARKQRIHGDGD